ncbi:MAG: ribonuclease Z [Acidobacteria bacterium]|nr:ribonuclease Z [Acidobacteriota bacterium]
MRVIPLGTSSGKPTLRRNVSALAVAREGDWLLFDCGEGTQTQIIRAGLNPSRLAAIFITHLHGDHFNGLAGLLSTMGMDRRERQLTLIAPIGIREYLDTLARLKILFVNYPLQVREIDKDELPPNALTQVYETAEYVVSSCPLDHRIFALGYRLDEKPKPGRFNVERARELGVPVGPLFSRLQSGKEVQLDDGSIVHPAEVLGAERPGKSVTYCLDTRPCAASKTLARDADLLIHEATYTEEFFEEAQHYGHSTAMQAATIAREAQAKRLLLTHFSTRYPDVTPLLEEAQAIFSETRTAQDLIEVNV